VRLSPQAVPRADETASLHDRGWSPDAADPDAHQTECADLSNRSLDPPRPWAVNGVMRDTKIWLTDYEQQS